MSISFPILANYFPTDQKLVLTLIKTLQKSTRQVQTLCGYTKVWKWFKTHSVDYQEYICLQFHSQAEKSTRKLFIWDQTVIWPLWLRGRILVGKFEESNNRRHRNQK